MKVCEWSYKTPKDVRCESRKSRFLLDLRTLTASRLVHFDFLVASMSSTEFTISIRKDCVTGSLHPPDACHCSDRRNFSGHFFASTDVLRNAVSIDGAEVVRWFSLCAKVRRGFCSVCGSSRFWDAVEKDCIAIAMVRLICPRTPNWGCTSGLLTRATTMTLRMVSRNTSTEPGRGCCYRAINYYCG